MKNVRLTAVVAVVSAGFLGGYLSSCGQTGGGACNSICQGCCDLAGLCQTGTLASACGTGAAMCQQCTSSQLCVSGVCKDVMIVDLGVQDAGVQDSGVPDSGMQMAGDGGTCKPGMFCGRLLYTGNKTGVAINFVLHNTDPVMGPPSKLAKMDAGSFPMNFEFPATSFSSTTPLAPGDYYFITWLDVMDGDSTSGPNYAVDPVCPPKTMPRTPAPKQTIPAGGGGATPLDITLQDP